MASPMRNLPDRNPTSPACPQLISPSNYWNQYLLNEKGVTFENSIPKENYDTFKYHELGGTLKLGMTSPWYEYHDIYADVNATVVVPHERVANARHRLVARHQVYRSVGHLVRGGRQTDGPSDRKTDRPTDHAID